MKEQTPSPVKSFFDIVTIILEKKAYPSDEDIQKHCNQYMCNQMLSCDVQLAEIAHEMGKLKITNKMYFDCLYNGIPKVKKYIKWNATKAKKEQHILYLMEWFRCSQTTAKSYVQLIEKSEMDTIVEYFEKRGVVKK
jgi:hypothetical protein